MASIPGNAKAHTYKPLFLDPIPSKTHCPLVKDEQSPCEISPWFNCSDHAQSVLWVIIKKILLLLIGMPPITAVAVWTSLALVITAAPFNARAIQESLGLLLIVIPSWYVWGRMARSLLTANLGPRVRTVLFGSFPTVPAHLAAYFLLAAVIVGIDIGAIWLFRLIPSYGDVTVIYLLSLVATLVILLTILVLINFRHALVYLMIYRRFDFNDLRHSTRVPGPNTPTTLIAHMSDLHLTCSPTVPRMEGGEGGNLALERLLSKCAHAIKEQYGALFLTGDITDSGQGAEWCEFFRIMPSHILHKTVITPGNHDLNMPPSGNVFGSLSSLSRQIRLLRFILAMDRVQGERTYFVDDTGHLKCLRHYLRAIEGSLIAFIRFANGGSRKEGDKWHWAEIATLPSRIWSNIFPLVVRIPDSPLVALVLDSNAPSSNILTNAFGSVGQLQRERLSALLASLAGTPKVILLHHHLSDRLVSSLLGGNPLKAVSQRFLGIHDGPELVGAIQGSGALVLNGHRHVHYAARINLDLEVISAESTTLGDESTESPHEGGAYRSYGITWDTQGRVSVVTEALRSI